MIRTENRHDNNNEVQSNSANKNEGVNDSRIVLMVQENPNMPDSALIPNPYNYPEEDLNILPDEENEAIIRNSANRLNESSHQSSK